MQVTGGVWTFSRICCDVFVTMDVMMCTASILNLCAISIDSWFGLQIHCSGETSAVPVQHWAELLQEGLSHDRGSLDAGIRSVMPSPLWLQYYRGSQCLFNIQSCFHNLLLFGILLPPLHGDPSALCPDLPRAKTKAKEENPQSAVQLQRQHQTMLYTQRTQQEENFAKQMPGPIFPLSPAQMLRPGDVYQKKVADCLQPPAVPQLLPR